MVDARCMTPPKFLANDHEGQMACDAKKMGDFLFGLQLKPRKSADELGDFRCRMGRILSREDSSRPQQGSNPPCCSAEIRKKNKCPQAANN